MQKTGYRDLLKNRFGETPLHLSRNLKVTLALIKAGAKVNVKNM